MISGYPDRKHNRSSQVRVMRIIARIIIIAVDVGKAGGLFTQSSWSCYISNQILIFLLSAYMGERKWGCRGAGSCVFNIRSPALVLASEDSSLQGREQEPLAVIPL